MKRTFKHLMLAGILAAGLHVKGQEVIDISTGIASNMLIAFHQPDDDWKISLPSSPSIFVGVPCGSGYVPTYTCGVANSYPWIDPSVRWLSPYMSCPPGTPGYAAGVHTADADTGYFYYRMEFDVKTCDVDSAVLHFPHIGADDYIDQIIINNNPPHSVFYSWPNLAPGAPVLISSGEINAAGSNTIRIRVHNGNSQMGMIIRGDITIYGAYANPAFSLANIGGVLVATPSGGTGSHSWEVYGSNSGAAGTYVFAGTYTGNQLSIPSQYACYYVKHSFTNECGTSCASQSLCKLDCDNEELIACTLPAPQDLSYTAPDLNWSVVPGAVSYIIEVTTNDTSCCTSENQKPVVTYTFSSNNNTYSVNLLSDLGIDTEAGCFSWRVIPVCKNGYTGMPSAKYCSSGSPAARTAIKTISDEAAPNLNIYPNPAKGLATITVNSSSSAGFSILVLDISGRAVKSFEAIKPVNKQASIQLNTQTLDKGTYLVKVQGLTQQISKKLIIE